MDLESGDDPACRSISLKDVPDPTVFPKALAIPLNALKGPLDPVCELLGVVLAAAAGVDGDTNAGWPIKTCFAAVPRVLDWPKALDWPVALDWPMALDWPNTDPGVAGTGILGADACPPPKALTV